MTSPLHHLRSPNGAASRHPELFIAIVALLVAGIVAAVLNSRGTDRPFAQEGGSLLAPTTDTTFSDSVGMSGGPPPVALPTNTGDVDRPEPPLPPAPAPEPPQSPPPPLRDPIGDPPTPGDVLPDLPELPELPLHISLVRARAREVSA